MITSYHNHTVWSDGRATPLELAHAARAAGVDELGVSDHLMLHPAGRVFDWRLGPENVDRYLDELARAAEQSGQRVRAGVEADFFPETVERLRALLASRPFDFVIGSVHFVDGFSVDADPDAWRRLAPRAHEAAWTVYWQRVRQLAESGVFDIAAHLDLPKRFGVPAPEPLSDGALAALDAIARADMTLEINTAGWYLPANEAYPSPLLLRAARERGIPVMINADAHDPANLVRGFGRARTLAHDAGYTEVARYAARRRSAVPLDIAGAVAGDENGG